MPLLSDLGAGDIPNIDITPFLSSSWFYVLIIVIFAVILIIGLLILIFFLTWKKKIILFENISGQGYQVVYKSRARTIRLGVGGEELLKTLFGKYFVSAYGRKMGTNTFWYAKGQDGYWYNVILGDLDTKKGILDIDPVDRDVRMFHVALDRLSHQTYDKKSFMEKYGVHLMLFLFLIVLVLGMWFIVGKIGEAVAPLAQAGDNAVKIQQANDATLAKLDNLIRALGYETENLNRSGEGGSGLEPAT